MLRLENITVKYEDQTVIQGLDFCFENGKFYGITGLSGIGKTTLFSVASQLIKPTSGKIITDGEKIGYVFQDARLFPWMTTLENVECVGADKNKAKAYLDVLLPDCAEKYPYELSGGMRQRVSIARALAYECDILLLDEPFKGLDGETKKNVMSYLSDILVGKTAVLVTHDEDELCMCDKVFSLESAPVTHLCEVKSGSASAE